MGILRSIRGLFAFLFSGLVYMYLFYFCGFCFVAIQPLGLQRNKDEKGSIRSTLVSKSKHVPDSAKAPGISSVGLSDKRESASGKLPRVSNVEVSSKYPSSSRIQRRPSTTGLSGKHTSTSGRPPRPSNVDILGKPASNTSKSRVCPPIAKGVSRRVPVTDASKRKTRLQRAFTSTLTARSEVRGIWSTGLSVDGVFYSQSFTVFFCKSR